MGCHHHYTFRNNNIFCLFVSANSVLCIFFIFVFLLLPQCWEEAVVLVFCRRVVCSWTFLTSPRVRRDELLEGFCRRSDRRDVIVRVFRASCCHPKKYLICSMIV
uniref:Uncharacterized protein n=1 Tax=Trypanosoma congolense (strain IL3000) TaxID=1068625 RepID=G0UKY6_TRYCI|nr:hypothetical protein, unlikely [Trypanosoma congolense IL3000]